MATPAELRTVIRFGLDQLGARNAHHEFEHLCRHLARARICSNILPSTGPVSAGGDQGRDFETFRTFLAATAPGSSIFAGLASQERIAFACTTQAQKLESKIRDDVATIVSSGLRPSHVHMFLTRDLPTAKRHVLQEWARDQHSVELDIHDGNAIAELLSDPDIFWIASKYLEIPAAQFPDRGGPSWYAELAERVRHGNRDCATHGQFLDLKRLIRHATVTDGLKSDVPHWIAMLAKAPKFDAQLRRAAMYETFVASLRALGSLEGYEEEIKRYFGDVDATTSSADLRDAAVLISFCIGALYQNTLRFDGATLVALQAKVIARVDALLAESPRPNTRCSLLDVRWFATLTPTPNQLNPERNLDVAFPWLEQLAESVGDAPLFPLENLIDNLTKFQKLIPVTDRRRYQALTAKLDAALAEREGASAVAEKLRDRAIAFLDADEPLVALRFIHDANVGWFTSETLRGSLLAQLTLATIYASLGLCKAAQYFALAEAFIAINSDNPGIRGMSSRGILAAAEHAYVAGEWLRFLTLAELGLTAHGQLAPDAGDLDRYPEVTRIASCAVSVVAVLEKVAPQSAANALVRIRAWGLDWLLDDMLKAARSGLVEKSVETVWREAEKRLWGPPLADAGPTRRAEWRQFGLRWRFEWANENRIAAAAEELIATLQIALADLAEEDLCLLPLDVLVEVRLGPFSIVREHSNTEAHWILTILESEDADQASLATAAAVLHELSVLPSEAFIAVLETRLKSGLSSKVFIAKPYSSLFRDFVQARELEAAAAASPLSLGFCTREHPALAWCVTPGPYYTQEDPREVCERRYARLLPALCQLLPSLRMNRLFRETLANLRADGWRDWHVLSAVYTTAINYLAQNETPRLEKLKELHAAYDIGAPLPNSVPSEIFTEEALRWSQDLNMVSTLRGLGHELHQPTPHFRGIERFLAERYRYWEGDADHDDPFADPPT